jgi:hypothetical protein
MRSRTSGFLLKIILAISVLVVITIIVYANKLNKDYQIKAGQATSTQVMKIVSSFTVTPTFTATPIPSATVTQTPLPTLTLTPTMVPTNTPIPCFATAKPGAIFYRQPSSGRSVGALPIGGSSIPLYFHLQNEDWWATSINGSKGEMVDGWVRSDDISMSSDCKTLAEEPVASFLINIGEEVIVQDDFSSLSNIWKNRDGSQTQRTVGSEFTALYLRSGDDSADTSFLSNEVMPPSFSLITSVEWENFAKSSYIGIGFYSLNDPNKYVEVRFQKNNCQVVYVANGIQSPPISLANVTDCDSGEKFIKINFMTDGSVIHFSGTFNDSTIPEFQAQDVYDQSELGLSVVQGTTDFNYLIITGGK